MKNFDIFLNSFSKDNNIKGKQFEYFVKWFLKNDTYWKSIVKETWFFKDAPINWGSDKGTDIIFLDKDNRYWAIQAKHYNPNYSIKKSDIDSFLSDSNRKIIFKRIIFSSTNKYARNGIQTIKSQEKKVQLFGRDDFLKLGNIFPNKFSNILRLTKYQELIKKDHQKKAILSVQKGFQKNNKGQLIMACGTGKTLTCYWIHKYLKSKKTLILVPSLNLISQTIREWYRASNESFYSLSICSDPSTVKNIKEDEIALDPSEIPYSISWDINEIKSFFQKRDPTVTFATYQSSRLIKKAQESLKKHKFDLVIADEAHKCVGNLNSDFATVLDDSKIKSKKKLFTTATPKVFSKNIVDQAKIKKFETVDMNDEARFGKVLYKFPFSEAIKKNQLTDYKLVLMGVSNDQIKQFVSLSKSVVIKNKLISDSKSLASQIGLVKAIKDHNLSKIISFHGNIEKSKYFSEIFPSVFKWMKQKFKNRKKVTTDYVSGKMLTYVRKLKLDKLKSVKQNEIGLLSNARCLSEGVDVPTLDGIIFFDTRESEVDIVQSVGRVIRKSGSPKKKFGYIIVPVFVSDKKNIQKTLNKSNYKTVFKVINALRSHDDSFKIEIDNLKINSNKKTISSRSKKIIIDLPENINKNFQEKINTFIIDKIPNEWEFYIELLKNYENEFNTTIMSQNLRYKSFRLGSWCNEQRFLFNKNKLQNSRIEILEKFTDWSWNLRLTKWQKMLNLLREYVQHHNKLPMIETKYKGENLGIWCGHMRAFYRDKKLSKERINSLDSIPLWIWEHDQIVIWKNNFNKILNIYKKTGKSHIERKRNPKKNEEELMKLAEWQARQRQLYKKGLLEKHKIKKFENSFDDWVWGDFLEIQWEKNFQLLCKYFNKFGTTKVKQSYVFNGVELGKWVHKQRYKYNDNKIEKNRILKLEKLGDWAWK